MPPSGPRLSALSRGISDLSPKFLAPPPRTEIRKFDRFQPAIIKSYRFPCALKFVAVRLKRGPLPIGGGAQPEPYLYSY
jgi:hypothetical protein